MEVPRVATPQAAFTRMEQQHRPVGDVGFYLQRYRAAIDKGVIVRDACPVIEQALAPVHRFIARHCRAAHVAEEHLVRIREEVVIVAALRRELRHRQTYILVRMVLLQVLRAEHPFAAPFCIGIHRHPEVVAQLVPLAGRMEAVRHACRQPKPLHARQTALRLRPVRKGKAQRHADDDTKRPFHLTSPSVR